MENDISITFTKEEVGLFLKLLYSGTFIVVPKDEKEDKTIDSIVQKVLLSTKMAKHLEVSNSINLQMSMS